ncbi:hypothetical protein H3U50_00025 [Lactobacillus sp. M0398]|uniref:hypothetical protein n=1 Tax=Lactobacillus TaxID=1578 RepID=UPI0018DD834C|nr:MULTISPECIES: hypothetical protein [unclassified Lactobacillus]MBI0120208.1 hypothetical protein [Lactobacillus sp. M0398]MBI0122356.1 hypothetical protein [Lactobacillus sp. W8174]MBI0134580.1 hypothetical protein [Lactobacillus sp. W8173]
MQRQFHAATIPDVSLVTPIKKPTVENADLTAILIDNEATIKHVKLVGDKVILIFENNDYDLDCFKKRYAGKNFR